MQYHNTNDSGIWDKSSHPRKEEYERELIKPPGEKFTKCIITFQMTQNPQRIDLQRTLDLIRSVRVKQLSWLVNPIDSNATMLYLSCPELLKDGPQQSGIMVLQPSIISSNQMLIQRSILASWDCAPEGSNTLNYQNNGQQSTIDLPRLLSLNKLTFSLETELGPVTFDANDKVSVTIEFEVKL